MARFRVHEFTTSNTIPTKSTAAPTSNLVRSTFLFTDHKMNDNMLHSMMEQSVPIALANMNSAQFNYHVGKVVKIYGSQHVGIEMLNGSKKIKVPPEQIIQTGISHKLAARLVSSSTTDTHGSLHAEDSEVKNPLRVFVLDAQFGYSELIAIFGSRGRGLPDHVVRHAIAPFFICERVSNYACVAASSCRSDSLLTSVTIPRDDLWWISGSDNFSMGSGREWLEFCLGDGKVIKRVSAIVLKIPPLPHGPLSVRKFHIEYEHPESKGLWTPHEQGTITLLDVVQLQPLALVPPIDTCKLRVVFTQSAVGELWARQEAGIEGEWTFTRNHVLGMGDCVGLFQVAFW